MRRHLLGIIALALIGIGLRGYMFVGSNNDRSLTAIVLFRAGLVLGALWLALPQIATISPWVIGSVLIGGAVIMLYPKLILFVIGAGAFVLALQYAARIFLPKFLNPPSTRRSTRQRRE